MKKVFIVFFAVLLSLNIAFAAELSISTDKSEYIKGDTVSISSALSPAGNETISDASITIKIEQDGGLIKETTISGTSASYQWVADRTGSINIKVTGTWSGQSKTVESFITVKTKALSATLTGIKDKYYPAEYPEARITVTDESGKVVTDASITASLLKDGKSMKSIYFSYSALCDCYKSWIWIQEGYLGNYMLDASISRAGYDSVSLTKSFEVVKPSVILTVATDKKSYYPEEKIAITVTAKDKEGNLIAPYLSGEIRDDKGFLIENLYPWKDGDVYKEDYYIKTTDVGKTLNITVNGDYKEQKDSKSVLVSVSQIGLMAEVFLDKTTLKPGDELTGKVEVKDKTGKVISDAWVDANLYDSNNMQTFYISTSYKEGYYIFDKRQKISEWQTGGDYKLKVSVKKGGEKKEIEKVIRIEKNKLGVNIEFDKLSYKPGDRIYLKILLTDPEGTVIQDGWISGEIFPLSTETRQPEGWPSTPLICRMYLSPEGPIYYQGQFIQKYYVDEVYINDWCPIGTYVLRLKAGKGGYADVLIEKEFEVLLLKLLMETGTKIISEPDFAQVNIYAEIKDEAGNMIRDANIKGYLHPTEEKGCIREVYLYFDGSTKRYMTSASIDRRECPEGKYNLELTASHRSYSPVTATQIIEIRYREGYEYREITPIVTPEPACRVVSCGPECFQKTCEQEQPCKIKIDKDCIIKCKELKEVKDMESCAKSCERQECAPTGSSEQEMMKKLEEIHKEVIETKREVNIVQRMLTSIWNFIRSLFGLSSATKEQIIENATLLITETTETRV